MPSSIIPTLRYHDAPAAVTFLCDAFGFERRLVTDDGDGGVGHAELALGDGLVMVGSHREGTHRFDELVTTVRRSGGLPTSCTYVVVDDVEAAAERVVAGGGEILDPVYEQPYGGLAFSCADPEGNLWNVGAYDPWAT